MSFEEHRLEALGSMSLATDREPVGVQEKQRATEIAIEEMSERVEFLEAENRQLQKTLEDATHTVKVLACSLLMLLLQILDQLLGQLQGASNRVVLHAQQASDAALRIQRTSLAGTLPAVGKRKLDSWLCATGSASLGSMLTRGI